MKHKKNQHILFWILGLTLQWLCPAMTALAATPIRPLYDSNAMAEVSSALSDIALATNDSTDVDNDSIKTDSIRPHSASKVASFRQRDSFGAANSHQQDSIKVANFRQLDAINAHADTTQLYSMNDSIQQTNKKVKLPKKQFVPDPQRALWLSLVFPGAGQIYNRKYWKLPIIYGGFLGCTYALLWNQQMYMDYSQAYLDIMDDDPNTHSYEDMLPPRYDITGQEERFKKIFKNKKDRFRRYRDLSAFCFVGVYLISVIDAYVDAQLSEFDITPDLSLRLEPAVIQQKGISADKNAYGVGCSFNF